MKIEKIISFVFALQDVLQAQHNKHKHFFPSSSHSLLLEKKNYTQLFLSKVHADEEKTSRSSYYFICFLLPPYHSIRAHCTHEITYRAEQSVCMQGNKIHITFSFFTNDSDIRRGNGNENSRNALGRLMAFCYERNLFVFHSNRSK